MIAQAVQTRPEVEKILQKAYEGNRLEFDEAMALFDADFLELGRVADHRCRELRPDNVVTFLIDLNLNYTNVCVTLCKFCAFYRHEKDADAYLLSNDEILAKVEEMIALGGTQVLLQGGHHPRLGLEYYVNLTRQIKERFNVHMHSYSAAEIHHMASVSKVTLREAVTELKLAGLDSIPGGGAEILSDRVRNEISPLKISVDEWFEVMEIAHELGMHTTATMMFGSIETLQERTEHLFRVRKHQDRTGKFRAFIPWSFSPEKTELEYIRMSGGFDYLRMLAISRLVLDNFRNVQAGWVTEGDKVCQLGLSFGANDVGGILMEERVISATGLKYQTTVEQVLRMIRKAGKVPAQRNTKYDILRLYR
ncbi:MAG: dehypoxanthine futalosine cyclase [Candidatus Omnitrophica bacterium]|nr:dehypoxanthine futalosine cyclase [Candidatus Omnitrophota bacterium]